MDKVYPDYGGRNVAVNEAARIMGKSPQFVRIGLQRGLLPIGIAMKTNDRNEQYDYYISPKLLAEFTGHVCETVEQCQDSIVSTKILTQVNHKEVIEDDNR